MAKRGRPRKNPDAIRKSFLWHPDEQTARRIEELCVACDLSANAVITILAGYGLERAQLQPKTVQEVGFTE